MRKCALQLFEFIEGYKYCRLSIYECARIQVFPNDFEFIYKNVAAGYNMIGNAVAVLFYQAIALSIKEHLKSVNKRHFFLRLAIAATAKFIHKR